VGEREEGKVRERTLEGVEEVDERAERGHDKGLPEGEAPDATAAGGVEDYEPFHKQEAADEGWIRA